MDNELLQKLRIRRSVVDSKGTSWVSEVGEGRSPLARGIGGVGFGNAVGSTSLPTPRTAGPVAVEKNKNQLAQILQRRRSVVDCEGTAWDNVPEPSVMHDKEEPPSPSEATVVRLEEPPSPSESQPQLKEAPAETGCTTHKPENTAMTAPPVSRDEGSDSNPGIIEAIQPRVWQKWEPQPWEVLRRHARTWVCEVWLDEWLQPQDSSECNTELPVETNPYDRQPAVLCLTGGGEIMCCVAAPAPPDAGEEADYARLLGSFQAALLVKISTLPAAPHALGFHIDHNIAGNGGSPKNKELKETGNKLSGGGPALLARFESATDAESCAAAVTRAMPAPIPISEGPSSEFETMLPGFLEATTLPEMSSLVEDIGEIIGSNGGSGIDKISGAFEVQAPKLCKLGPLEYAADAQNFLHELDQLAGFA